MKIPIEHVAPESFDKFFRQISMEIAERVTKGGTTAPEGLHLFRMLQWSEFFGIYIQMQTQLSLSSPPEAVSAIIRATFSMGYQFAQFVNDNARGNLTVH